MRLILRWLCIPLHASRVDGDVSYCSARREAALRRTRFLEVSGIGRCSKISPMSDRPAVQLPPCVCALLHSIHPRQKRKKGFHNSKKRHPGPQGAAGLTTLPPRPLRHDNKHYVSHPRRRAGARRVVHPGRGVQPACVRSRPRYTLNPKSLTLNPKP